MAATQFYVEKGADVLNTRSGVAVKVELSKKIIQPRLAKRQKEA